MKKLVIAGAGGFAREVRWLVEDINRAGSAYEFIGYIVSDLSKVGEHDSRDQILGDFSWIDKQNDEIAVAIGIGTPAARLLVGLELRSRSSSLQFPPLVHPSAQFDRQSCTVEEGTIICAGTIGTVNVRFERFCMVNLSCTIGHEAIVGPGVVMNPTVNISGGVHLKQGVLVGTGAQILQYVTVGENAIVGAGAVVTRNVDPNCTVVGCPAKPLPSRS